MLCAAARLHALRKVDRSLITRSASLSRLVSPPKAVCPFVSKSRTGAGFRSAGSGISSTPSRRSIVMSARSGEASCFPNTSRSLSGLTEGPDDAVVTPIQCIGKDGLDQWLSSQPGAVASWVAATQFKGKDGEVCTVPSPEGGIQCVLLGVEDPADLWAYSGLPSKLTPGTYKLTGAFDATSAALGWALGTYSFDRYKSKKAEDKKENKPVGLVWPDGSDSATVTALAEAIFLARDMITTPAEDMAPQDIVAEAVALAAAHGASTNVIVGDDLLTENYPAIHTVGRASVNPPHLVDLRWAPKGADAAALPKVTLVGKGVSFDTGGLDLKPANAMKLMKKDMGGSALVLALAHVVMKTHLPVALRVLVPAVENSVSGNAFRPLDVLQTRAGITVENGNTDAEGRLILCDALAEAVKEAPELLIDAATLTGAARVALGTELPALFCNNDAVAEELLTAGADVNDPVWRLPLHKPYRKMLDSKVADIYSCSEGGYAGAITAALFLQEFVKEAPAWVHLDTMGYNLSSKPGRPEGGEAFALRALYEFLRRRYAK